MLYSFIDLFSGAIVPFIVILLVFGIIKKAGIRKIILIVLFMLYLAKMVDKVGIPYIQVLSWNPIFNIIPFSDLFQEGLSFWVIFQFVANIVLFIPLGIFLPVIWKSFRQFHATVIAGALMSICIEFSQLFSARVTATDDLLMNTLGTVIGYLIIAGLLKKRWKKNDRDTGETSKRDRIESLLVVGAVFLSAIFVKYTIGGFIYSLPLFQ